MITDSKLDDSTFIRHSRKKFIMDENTLKEQKREEKKWDLFYQREIIPDLGDNSKDVSISHITQM